MMRRNAKLGIVAGLSAFLVLAGTTASYGYWTAQATASSTAGSATLAITSSAMPTTTLGNEDVVTAGSISLTDTSSITLTNTTNTTSTQVPALSIVFSRASGDATLATQAGLVVWATASAANCTPAAAVGPGSVSGTWNAGVTVSTTLAQAATVIYCMRTTVADRQTVASASGARSFVPQALATLTVSNYAGGVNASGTMRTQYVYPLATFSQGRWNYFKRNGTTWCADANAQGTASGTALIAFACKYDTSTNQDFRVMDPDGDGYVDIRPGHATGLRIDVGASTTPGSPVTLVTANSSSASQQWQIRLISTGVYQFINKYSGLCLSIPAVSVGAVTQVACTGAIDQQIALELRSVVQLTSFTCANTGAGTTRSVTYSWTADWNGGGYTVQAKSATNVWTTITSAGASNATTAAVPQPIGAPLNTWTAGTYNVQILDVDSDVVGTTTITITGTTAANRYARC